jgi:hypothetical protein
MYRCDGATLPNIRSRNADGSCGPGRTAEKETVPPNNVDPKIERRPIGPLRPYERNARKHPPEQVAQIAVAIREWGWTVRIIAWLIGYNWRRSRRSKFQKRLPDR